MEKVVKLADVLEMLNRIDNAVYDGEGYRHEEWVEYAKNLPTENPAKVGKWIIHYDYLFMPVMRECDKCHRLYPMYFTSFCSDNYCSNCGSKMEGTDDRN